MDVLAFVAKNGQSDCQAVALLIVYLNIFNIHDKNPSPWKKKQSQGPARNISVPSHERHGVSNHYQLICLLNRLR